MDKRLEYAPCGYVSITQDGRIADVNQTFLERMGYKKEALVNMHFESLMSTANKLMFHSYFYPYIHLNGRVEELFIRLNDYDGQVVSYLLNGRRVEVDGNEVIDCVLVEMGKRISYEIELRTAKENVEKAYKESDQAYEKLKAIHLEIEKKQAELIEMNTILMELSVTDKLTGMKNRRYFQDSLAEKMEAFKNGGPYFSLCIVDIDHFKRVNDTYGHQVGDYVLERLATLLKAHAGQNDIVARYGGEEFVVILPEVDVEESLAIAENYRMIIEQSNWDVGNITISIGVATVVPEDTSESILYKADQALYHSKENGRNRVTHAELRSI